jgi:hypothetical protein
MSTKLAVVAAAILAVVAGQAVASPRHPHQDNLRHNGRLAPQLGLPANAFDQDVTGTGPQGPGFGAFPTDYLINRFGDFQSQGR